MRAALAFLALAGLAGPALAQTCIEGPGGMRMCDNGFMSMGGMSMQLPTPPAVPPGFIVTAPPAPPGGFTRWTAREFVQPDGSRRQVWESETTYPDGRVVRDAQTRIVMPDGRVCTQSGSAAPDCPR